MKSEIFRDNKMEIVFLGTAGAIPSKTRNLPAIVFLYNGEQLLFDAGEDIQRKFEEASLKFNAPLTIFISHMHGDHIIGLPGLLFHFSLIQRTTELNIFGPPGIYNYLIAHKHTVGLKAPFLNQIYEIYYHTEQILKYNFQEEFDQKPKVISIVDNTIFESKDYFIKCLPMCHSVISYGFKFIEKPRPGEFYPEKAKNLGIPMGRLWKRMQMGNTIDYNAKLIDPIVEGIIGPKRPGIVISYSSDTMVCDNLIKIAQNSDYFICESTYSEELKDLAQEKMHMTASQCGRIAKKANVNTLILTHISSRYAHTSDVLLNEAKQEFPNSILAQDLLRILVERST